MTNIAYQQQQPTKTNKKWVRTGLLFAFLLLIASILSFLYPFASKEKVAYFIGENPILFYGKQVGNGFIDGDTVYVPVTFLEKHIDKHVYFDEGANSVIITTTNKVIQMPTESLTYYVNQTPVQLRINAIEAQDGELYVALDPILPFYNIEYSILPNSEAIEIRQDGLEITKGTIHGEDVHREKLRLRMETSLQSPYTSQVEDKEKITIEKEENEYYYIRKEDGTSGYINAKYVQKRKTETVQIKNNHNEVSLPVINGPINLTWEAVYTKNPDLASLPIMPGVNVVSPTWFELSSADGSIKNLGSLEYVNWAKGRGYQVWALFSNAFDPNLTHEAFKSYETRQNIIRQLLVYSQMYQLDGINIDIENVKKEDGPLVTQFVREATAYLHQAGLIVSMDITFIAEGNWSAFYERDRLAETVDYLMVMAYDEHWGTSPKAGSVASFPWVEQNLEKLLEVVPNDKLILGVPLYARLWEVKDTGEVSSKALKMSDVKEWIASKGVTPVYDEKSGQNYTEYYDVENGATYKIWLEDELSLSKRADLAVKYQLKGVASWSRYFADDSAWLALSGENKQVVQN